MRVELRQNLPLDKERKIVGEMRWVILPITENRFHFRKDSKICQGILVLRFYDFPEIIKTSLGNAKIKMRYNM